MNAKNIVGATSALLYKFNSDDKSFHLLFQAGKDAQYGTEFAEICVNERKERLFLSEEINEILFPQLKDVDMDNVYISELEALIDGFLEVNFSMMKKVFMKVTTMM